MSAIRRAAIALPKEDEKGIAKEIIESVVSDPEFSRPLCGNETILRCLGLGHIALLGARLANKKTAEKPSAERRKGG